MGGPRIGSLCSGYGGLDEAVQQVEGGELVWVADNDPGAEKILSHHHPDVSNLGDITAVDWADVPPVDILTMGFPCQDVSVAGLRAGLLQGNRSGLWFHCARAIQALNPSLVVIENVPGLLAARADGDVEPCAWCLGDGGASLLCEHLVPFSETWPASGSMRSGRVFPRLPSEPATSAIVSSSSPGLPTPRARDWKAGGKDGLHEKVRMLPTPRASDGEKGGPNQRGSKGDLALSATVAHLLPTPTATPYGNNQSPSPGAAVRPSLDSLVPKLLPTPRTSDANGGGQHGDGGLDLRTAVGSLAAADADGEPGAERGDAASGEAQGGGGISRRLRM